MSTVETEVRTYGQLIGGKWVDAAGERTYENRDPFTGEVFAQNAAATAADAERAIEAAAAAAPGWAQSPPAERQRDFLTAADILESRTQEIVGLLARESGASFGFGMFQPAMFGPVASVEIVDSAEAAVARANATTCGLSAGIITTDKDRGFALGGVKDSGFGRFGGSAVVDEFTELRWVTVQRGSHPFPF